MTRKPIAPTGLDSHARGVWRRFWSSPVAAVADPEADYDALQHWILAVDERERLIRRARLQPLVTREGASVLNPLFRRIRELTADIEKAQEAFGMTPMARARLGINLE